MSCDLSHPGWILATVLPVTNMGAETAPFESLLSSVKWGCENWWFLLTCCEFHDSLIHIEPCISFPVIVAVGFAEVSKWITRTYLEFLATQYSWQKNRPPVFGWEWTFEEADASMFSQFIPLHRGEHWSDRGQRESPLVSSTIRDLTKLSTQEQ